MTYICNECGATFQEPKVLPYEFEHAFGVKTGTVYACPHCNSSYISEPSLCKNCNSYNYVKPGEILCKDCRSDLLHRICAFFDTLTAKEIEQFEEWMDGSSIYHRKDWGKDL
jgi:predicted amidophosphoribosyltransferase